MIDANATQNVSSFSLEPGKMTNADSRYLTALYLTHTGDPDNVAKREAYENAKEELYLKYKQIHEESQRRREEAERNKDPIVKKMEKKIDKLRDQRFTLRETVKSLEQEVGELKQREEESKAEKEALLTTVERLRERLQAAEVKFANSTQVRETRTQNVDELDASAIQSGNVNLNLNSNIAKELSESLTGLRRTLESSKNNSSLNTKQSRYILNRKSDITIWYDKLKSELISKDLLDVIDPEIPEPENLEENTHLKRKNTVREIIAHNLDDSFYKQIINIREPREMLVTIRESKRLQNNVTHTSVRTRIYQLKMNRKESVANFFDKFDDIIREYECCVGAITLTEEEKRSALLQAVSSAVPEIVTHSITFKQTNNRDISTSEIKSFLLQLEAQNNLQRGRENSEREERHARVANVVRHKCHRCNDIGHWAKDCTLREGYHLHYVCKKIHLKDGPCPSDEERRPYRKNEYVNNKDHNTSNFGGSSRSRGQGNSRGGYNSNRGRRTDRGGNKGFLRDRGGVVARGRVEKRGKGSKRGNYTAQVAQATAQAAIEALKEHQAQYTGNDINLNNISFIADSGATEHIVNKSILLSNFKKCGNAVIKSANKNDSADIEIDGIGDLYLNSENNKIKLTNVLAAENITNNLISLRKFADLGFGIKLDKEKLEIYDKVTKRVYLTGDYEKPNWIISFSVKNKESENYSYTAYTCDGEIVSETNFTEQSRIMSKVANEKNKEGAEKHSSKTLTLSEIGRENKSSEIEQEPDEVTDFDLDMQTINRRIWDLNSLRDLEELSNIKMVELNPDNNKLERLDEGMLWHIRLGHPNIRYLKILQKNNTHLEKVTFRENINDCEVCKFAKMQKLPFRETRTVASEPLHTIHTDIMGKFKTASFPGNFQFIIVFIDDYSRFAKIYCIKHKSDAARCLEKYIITVRNLVGKESKVRYLRADNALEFTGGEFTEVLEREKIETDYAPVYTPELNGTAERFNKTIMQKTRALLIGSGIPESMWPFAAETAVNVYNRTPHQRLEFDTPLNRLNPKIKTHFEKIKRFGCLAYVYIPNTASKFSNRAIRAILVGYSRTGYILWEPTTQRFFNSRNVSFNEKLVYKDVHKTKAPELEIEEEEVTREVSTEESTREKEEKQEEESPTLQIHNDDKPKRGRPRKRKLSENEKPNDEEIKKTRVSSRPHKPNRNDMYVYRSETKTREENIISLEEIHVLLARLHNVPSNYREARQSEEKEEWLKAIEVEKRAIDRREVYEIVDRPKNEKVLDSRWIFSVKTFNDKPLHKSRLVVRGFQDENAYEIRDIYTPVSGLPLVRTGLAIINKEDLEARQSDVVTAFLYGDLVVTVYMEIPEGYDCSAEFRSQKVWKLKKALYGLPVSPKRWFERFKEEALKIDLENDVHEPCLFTWRKEDKMAFLMLYVDDMITASNCPEKLKEISSHFRESFEIKELGEPENFLGLKIERDRENRVMTITQPEYTEKMLEKFNMKDCKPQDTPMVTRQVRRRNLKGKENTAELEKLNALTKAPYREAIGSLMYLASSTRPDIAYAVHFLARKQQAPTEQDWQDVKRVFRYLRGTSEIGLTYKAEKDGMEAYADASFRDLEESTSTSGFVIKLYGDTVAWKSHKQQCPSLSTCQAEYMATSETSREVTALDKPIREILGKTMYPVTIWCDNSSTGKCTEKEGSHKLKDFDESIDEIKRRLSERDRTGKKVPMAESHGDYIKFCVSEGRVKVAWIPTDENIADVMTKPLAAPLYIKFREKLFNSI